MTKEREPSSSWSYEVFKEYLIEAVKKLEIPLAQTPREIQLAGPFAQRCDQMMSDTLSDPRKRERLRYIKLSLEEKLLISPESIGVETTVEKRVLIKSEGVYKNSEYLVLSVHTHGVADLPPSAPDCHPLITAVTQHGEQCVIVLAPSIRYLLLRTFETPELEPEEGLKRIQLWRQTLQSRMNQEVTGLRKHMHVYGGTAPYQENQLVARIQLEMLMKFCQENSIALYTADPVKDPHRYRRVNL